MATNMDKGLYAAPQGIDELGEAEENALEIDIVNPDMVTLDDGSVEITLVPDGDMDEEGFSDNLAEYMDEGTLATLASDLIELVDTDIPADGVSWTEIETYSPSFSKLTEYLRYAISTGYIGFRAGTEEAITETVKFFLDNNKYVLIDKNPSGTNRFSVTLYTYIGDTPDATNVGGTSELVRAAIQISKPIGIEVNHVILADV